MKKSKFFTFSTITIASLSICVLVSTLTKNIDINGYNAGEETGLYTLVMNKDTNPLNPTSTSATTEVKTQLGNTIEMETYNLSHSDGDGKIQLTTGGSIRNKSTSKFAISGMKSITVTFSGPETLRIMFNWEANKNMLFEERLQSGVPYVFHDSSPSYFLLSNGSETIATIDEISIEYNCEAEYKDIVEIQYLNKDTDAQIAEPTYLFINKNEVFGERGVTGKGKLEVDGKTYLPDKFWAAGKVDTTDEGKKTVKIYYTEASVYDGVYDPSTDETREVVRGETYNINSVEDLIYFEYYTRANPDVSFPNCAMNTSVDLTGYEWTGIGTPLGTSDGSTCDFEFNGNGYTIAGMNSSSNTNYTCFVYDITPRGVITNLTIEGSITTDISSEKAGALCYNTNGKIENVNCFIDVNYTSTSNKATYVGGLVGYSSASDSILDGINNYGNITINCGSSCGGIVGYKRGAEIINCANYGIVTIDSWADAENTGAGAIAGVVDWAAKVYNCTNLGTLNVNTKYFGTIVGCLIETSITYGCIAGGVVNPTNEANSSGGFSVGFVQSGSIVYGYTKTATDANPSYTVISGAKYINEKLPNGKFADVVYPSEGQFKVVGANDNLSVTSPIYI